MAAPTGHPNGDGRVSGLSQTDSEAWTGECVVVQATICVRILIMPRGARLLGSCREALARTVRRPAGDVVGPAMVAPAAVGMVRGELAC